MSDTDNQSLRPALPVWYRWQHAIGSLIGRRFDRLLDGIEHGQLMFTWPDGHTSVHGNKSDDPRENAHLFLHNFKPVRQIMVAGENGFAESYLRGDWSTDSLINLFTLIMNNESKVLDNSGGSWHAKLLNSLRHNRNRNSISGSRRNIEFHYDLGNRFYKLWLDPSMSYSSALFRDDESLEQAQQAKLEQVLHYLDPKPNAKVLEIGCGWGAMARLLATRGKCHVEGISLSHEQLKYAQDNNSVLAESGSGGSTSFQHQDYRQVSGTYDHIVSIEMFEAVGEQYWTTYFSKLGELLTQGGTAVLQVITIAEDSFDDYRASPDFIQRYIFPGGMLPTKTHLRELVNQAGFDIEQSDWFGLSYATTLRLWRDKFDQVSREVQGQGFDERFLRMWRYYLSYCETGFLFDRTDVGQLLLVKR